MTNFIASNMSSDFFENIWDWIVSVFLAAGTIVGIAAAAIVCVGIFWCLFWLFIPCSRDTEKKMKKNIPGDRARDNI